MSNYDDLNYYRQRLEDFMVWLAGEKIEFSARQANGILVSVPSGTVLNAYQQHREMVSETRCNRSSLNVSEIDESS